MLGHYIEIPTQLRKENFRFCKLRKQSKLPLEGESWKKVHQFNSGDLIYHMGQDENYGIVAGYGNLRIIDIDDLALAEELYKKMNTFTVQTCGGTYHFYILSDYETNHVLHGGKGEIRCHDMYVVGPNSYAIDERKNHAGYYTIVKDLPIAYYSKEQMEKLLQELGVKPKEYDFSRSGTEYKEILSLVKKGYSDERIESYMYSRGFTKWVEAPQAYRTLTIERARDAIAQNRLIKSEDLGVFTNYLDMAEKFIKLHPIYYDTAKIWWIWNPEMKCWQITDEVELMNLIDEHLRGTNTLGSNIKNMIIESLKRVSRKNKPQNVPSNYVQFQNGMFDIKTGEIIEATAEYFTTNPIPWDIGESEDTPIMDKIFAEWVGEKYVPTLYEIISYCLVGDYPLHRIFCFVGAGLNGKSKYLELINRFIGEYNVTSTELDTLLSSRFEITKLYKKLVCQMGETDFSTIKRTSILKKLSGQDTIGFEYKGKTQFDDKNYAKILIATNSLPISEDTSDGFYRRWMIIDFPNRFTEKKDILAEIPKEEYSNLAKKTIRILKELLERREFTNEGTIEDRKEKFEKKSNSVASFIEHSCITENDAETPFQEFYARFIEYCKENKLRELSAKMVGSILGNMGFERENKTITTTTNVIEAERISTTKRVIIGLKIKKIIDNNDNIGTLTHFAI